MFVLVLAVLVLVCICLGLGLVFVGLVLALALVFWSVSFWLVGVCVVCHSFGLTCFCVVFVLCLWCLSWVGVFGMCVCIVCVGGVVIVLCVCVCMFAFGCWAVGVCLFCAA